MEKKAIEVREEDLQPKDIVVDEDNVKEHIMVVEDSPVESKQLIQVGAWTNADDFVKYCVKLSRSAPEILPSNVNSLRRAIAFYDNLEKEIIDGATADADHAELNMNQLEVLDRVEEAVSVVRDQLKTAASRAGLLKTASKGTAFVYVVDPFLFAIARLCVNAKVANGKNIEDTFKKLATKFDINERETFSIQQIMRDMGYPITGSFVANEGSFDMIKQYFA
jgi:hypothetical protein